MENPYQTLYNQLNINISQKTTRKQAQMITMQLGLLYNTVGNVIKDLVKILNQNLTQPRQEQKIRKNQNQNNIKENNSKGGQKINKQLNQKSNKYQNMQTNNMEIESDIVELDFQQYQFKANDNSTHKIDTNNIKDSFNSNNGKQFKQNKGREDIKKNQTNRATEIIILIDQQPTPQDYIFQTAQKTQKNVSKKTQSKQKYSDLLKVSAKQVYRAEPMRKKRQREQQLGLSCNQCKKFYEAINGEISNLCQCTSRHRSNLPQSNFHNDYSKQFGFSEDENI